MPANFTQQQIEWAALHDWFIFGGAYLIVCLDQYADGTTAIVGHTNFQTLRDWAGY